MNTEKQWAVFYSNQGRRERTPPMTREAAKKSADFLKFQGATKVSIRLIT